MYKELIISIVIIAFIFLIDNISQQYTDKEIQEITQKIDILQKYIKEEKIKDEKISKDVDEIYIRWLKAHDTLAYFIEHNELEKVENDFVAGKSYIESKQYFDALCELDKTVFVLEHINEKYSFNLENIF